MEEQVAKEKLMRFLQEKVKECNDIIVKRKRKIKYIKIIHYTLISTSITGSAVAAMLSSFISLSLPIVIISTAVTVTTAISTRFDIESKKSKLIKNIQKLELIKDKLDYVTSCNGNLTVFECQAILEQFRIL